MPGWLEAADASALLVLAVVAGVLSAVAGLDGVARVDVADSLCAPLAAVGLVWVDCLGDTRPITISAATAQISQFQPARRVG